MVGIADTMSDTVPEVESPDVHSLAPWKFSFSTSTSFLSGLDLPISSECFLYCPEPVIRYDILPSFHGRFPGGSSVHTSDLLKFLEAVPCLFGAVDRPNWGYDTILFRDKCFRAFRKWVEEQATLVGLFRKASPDWHQNLILFGGSEGRGYGLHTDFGHSQLMGQLEGKKMVFLGSPDGIVTTARVSVFGENNEVKLEVFDKVPSKWFVATILPNEVVRIPPYWWHDVISVDGPALSFTHRVIDESYAAFLKIEEDMQSWLCKADPDTRSQLKTSVLSMFDEEEIKIRNGDGGLLINAAMHQADISVFKSFGTNVSRSKAP